MADLFATGFALLRHRADLERLATVIRPMLAEVPEISSIVRGIVEDVWPELAHQAGGVVATFDVHWLQDTLNRLGYGPLKVDGAMGPETHKATAKFQVDHDLAVVGNANRETVLAIGAEIWKKGAKT